jgi:hypothetical protein
MEENNDLFNFIITLYVGFFLVYITHPNPKILYKKIYLDKCKDNTQKSLCIDSNM